LQRITPEIHFNSIEEAKQFLSGIDNFSETNVNFFDEIEGVFLRGNTINFTVDTKCKITGKL